MPDSKDARGWICELLDMDDEKLLAELERLLLDSDERHQRIDDELEEMMLEVDRLLFAVEDAEDEPLQDEDETHNSGQR
ncbi:MAG TPA: hypothetical protein PLN19_02815 [Methanothrix sp.]|jgi:hypothetical protein|nr:hypothetical protein [Methanothrix sp.]HOV82573.1 hypothetical protein [Methanothrix sp.]HPC89116.1 hypothetical protein [Methanothrix sp.]HQE87186.1 hypothetical protein [Methanothrix sp.]HQI67907.1 hypothetical protein [Methanothrix sp.]